MSKHSRNDGRQPEQYARLSESPSEDESDEEFRQFLLTKGDRNDPAVRDMLKTIDRDRYERSAANGGPTLEYESHGLLALTVPHLHGPRPGRRAFGMRGVVLKSLWFLSVFVVSVVVQVVFMDAAKANGSGDWWPLMAVPNVGVFVIVFASMALSPFIVYAIGSLWPRLTVPFVMFASLAMLAVGSFVGQEVGRRWLWDRYVATGLLKPGDFVDWSSDRLPAPLAQPASGGWWVIGLVAGVQPTTGPTANPSLKPAAATTKTTTTVTKTTVAKTAKPKAATATTAVLPKTGDSNWIAASFTLLLLGLGHLGAAYRCWGVRHA